MYSKDKLLEAANWTPPGDAPKDGRRILANTEDAWGRPEVNIVSLYSDGSGWVNSTGVRGCRLKGWMPLPPPTTP